MAPTFDTYFKYARSVLSHSESRPSEREVLAVAVRLKRAHFYSRICIEGRGRPRNFLVSLQSAIRFTVGGFRKTGIMAPASKVRVYQSALLDAMLRDDDEEVPQGEAVRSSLHP